MTIYLYVDISFKLFCSIWECCTFILFS